MRSALSVFACDMPHRELGTPPSTCFGIDGHLVAGAPGDELVRFDGSSYNDETARLKMSELALGLCLPLVEGPGELFAILHDREDASVVAALIPSHAGRADPLRVHCSTAPMVSDTAIVAGRGSAASPPPKGAAPAPGRIAA